ncbi:hypothetical protein [Limibacterium fermenti]|uniref:hypothetical protein n=1 Tax=Limibacterium fermenti TaxID=3229863 RepID=UPI003A6150EF
MSGIAKILLISLVISLSITGIYATTLEGMIFHKLAQRIRKLLEGRKAKVLYKPLCGCLICMSSFWTIVAWLSSGFSFLLIPVMFCTAGINTIITVFIKDILPDE